LINPKYFRHKTGEYDRKTNINLKFKQFTVQHQPATCEHLFINKSTFTKTPVFRFICLLPCTYTTHYAQRNTHYVTSAQISVFQIHLFSVLLPCTKHYVQRNTHYAPHYAITPISRRNLVWQNFSSHIFRLIII
jgi:hypothetical protein